MIAEPSELTTEEADASIAAVYRDWFETCATIRGRVTLGDGTQRIEMTTAPDLQMNGMQQEIDEVVSWCELEGEPCKVIVLKLRKEGATTCLVGKSYHLLRGTEAQLLQIGDQTDTTQTMWDMLRGYQETDGFDQWPSTLTRMTTSAKAGARAAWGHGSSAWAETAGDKRAGQGTTPTIIHAEEVAHWGKDGAAANASDTMLALLNAIADTAGSYVFVSSTANGVGNWYHRTYGGAVTLAERKAGKKGNGWIKVFWPWHKSQWANKVTTQPERDEIEASLTEAELRGRILYGWRPGQIAWRREQIASKCDGDEAKFGQENPSDEVTCFLTSGNPRFNLVGVARIQAMAEAGHDKAKIGTLEEHNGQVRWIPDAKGWVWLSEDHIFGCSYTMIGDIMTGAQSAGSKERDKHAVGILREGYHDEQKVWHPTELVATIHVDDGCEWDVSILAERAARLAKYFGNCTTVPEANNAGMEYIARLQLLGADVWQREDMDHIRPGKKLKKPGYWTGPGKSGTRNAWVEKLAETLNECSGEPGSESFVCRYKPAAAEFGWFVRNSDGSCSAIDGKHDDWVAAIGIGLRVSCFSRLPLPESAFPQQQQGIIGPWT